MRSLLVFLGMMLSTSPVWSLVDMKNGNYADSVNHLTVPGGGYPLRVLITYNSRSLHNGIFGFGWCSDNETTLRITPEGTPRVTECGGGVSINYLPKDFDRSQYSQTVSTIIKEVQKRNRNLSDKYLKEKRDELASSDYMRSAASKEFDLRGTVVPNKVYYANGREVETVVFKNNTYLRTLSDKTFQMFDMNGHLSKMQDRNGNFIKYTWKEEFLISIVDNNGRKLEFSYHKDNKKVQCVAGPGNLKTCYDYKNDNLVKVVDAEKKTYAYDYDDYHNLIRINFPDKTFKALTYNVDKDWVTSFTDRNQCLESYNYELDKQNPKDHYSSTVTKKCGKEVVNKGRYEFWYKVRPDGAGKYLARVLTETNQESVDITYHEVFGKPLSVKRNNNLTRYSYFENGLIKTKAYSNRLMTFAYEPVCYKVSTLKTDILDEKGKKVLRTSKSEFFYEQVRCNLVAARNSEGQNVKLTYDLRGRIATITDQAKKVVKIDYEEKFGKPALVNRPGLGSIKVAYKASGEIDKVESKEGSAVALQVASIFNNLLDLIAPATAEVSL